MALSNFESPLPFEKPDTEDRAAEAPLPHLHQVQTASGGSVPVSGAPEASEVDALWEKVLKLRAFHATESVDSELSTLSREVPSEDKACVSNGNAHANNGNARVDTGNGCVSDNPDSAGKDYGSDYVGVWPPPHQQGQTRLSASAQTYAPPGSWDPTPMMMMTDDYSAMGPMYGEQYLWQAADDYQFVLNAGSYGHMVGKCKPCAFFHTKGCADDLNCNFCHLCDAGEKKRRQREKWERIHIAKQLQYERRAARALLANPPGLAGPPAAPSEEQQAQDLCVGPSSASAEQDAAWPPLQ